MTPFPPSNPTSSQEAAIPFLNHLHGRLTGGDGLVAFGVQKHVTGNQKRLIRHLYATPGSLPRQLTQKPWSGHHVYVSVCSFDADRWERDPRPKTKEGKGRQARQEDFALAAPALWADLDGPDDAGDLRAWQRDTWTELQAFRPEPSMVIFSGRGFHCYWLLLPPEKLDGNDRGLLVRQIRGCNQALKQRLTGGDAVHDLARFLRLPGWKNPKNGELCRIIKDDGPTYSLDELCDILTVIVFPEREIQASGSPTLKLPEQKPGPRRRGRPRKGATKRDLRSLPKWVRELVVEGPRAGGTRYRKSTRGSTVVYMDNAFDRSRADLAAAQAMVDAGWSDDKILGAFTRDDWGIGERFRHLQAFEGPGRAREYLARTVRKAKEGRSGVYLDDDS